MSARVCHRLRFLLWVLLLLLGVDQGVTIAQEIRSGAKDGHAWVRHSVARAPTCRLLPDFPDAGTALPAIAAELPLLTAWTRVHATAGIRPTPPRRQSPRSEYPRGPPA